MNVSLTVNEKPGPLHIFAALDVFILVMLLGFVSAGLVHKSGIAVDLPLSSFRFPSDMEAVVLTMKGASDPVFYIGSRRVSQQELVEILKRKRDEEGLRMVLLRADVRLPAVWQNRMSELILSEGLQCGWLGEAAVKMSQR